MNNSNTLPDYELPASFYLGKKYELNGRQLLEQKVLYDAKDLTTHAMCVGMTGSGKTGLCLAMLEEAALDGIPAICVDPKGDLGNLLLTFPELLPADFEPWIEPDEASRKKLSVGEYAKQIADLWRSGLASWDQQPERINRFREAVDIAIYTPGSNAGIPLTVLKNFSAPSLQVIEDSELFRERIAGTAAGLLTLLGNNADPLTSREHILLSNILDHAWQKGNDLDLPSLIRAIQNPPMDKVGVFDLESFFPASERTKFAMSLNNLLASPAFAGWLDGQPLDIKSLLYTSHGKPRLSIISIAHLNDTERMFFVTILLNELLSWMRTQPGTNSLRALFYMDEVYGYFPPTAKPPSKPPMMVLLKQARAFGLGVILATQNPVDLDYKGLANIGTWFLGRLQTERDKDRIIEGLEGASAQTGTKFDKAEMSQILAALGNRVFLMHNVHDDGPTVFQSRWAMSYLRGPLSRQQIQLLMKARRSELTDRTAAGNGATNSPTAVGSATISPDRLDSVTPSTFGNRDTTTGHGSASYSAAPFKQTRPIVPNGIIERFWTPTKQPSNSARRIYRPGVLASVACRYVQAASQLDEYHEKSLLYCLSGAMPSQIWRESMEVPPFALELANHPDDGFDFDDAPGVLLNPKSYKQWAKELADELYRNRPIQLYQCKELGRISKPGQDEIDARVSWTIEIRELRDQEMAKLRLKYSRSMESLESKIQSAKLRLEKEQAQYDRQKWTTILDVSTTVLGKLMGNRVSATKTATAGRGAARTMEKRSTVALANESLESLLNQRAELDHECQNELDLLKSRYSPEGLSLEPLELRCRKTDIKIDLLCLVWIPWQVSSSGLPDPLVNLPVLAQRSH